MDPVVIPPVLGQALKGCRTCVLKVPGHVIAASGDRDRAEE
jgi:hypothetical protein